MEDYMKLKTHVRRYHNQSSKAKNEASVVTPPLSDEEIVTPKSGANLVYERNSTMCEKKVI